MPFAATKKARTSRRAPPRNEFSSKKHRAVMILRDVEHLSINETAKVLGISEVNVKTRLLRARLQMRDAFTPGYAGAWSR